MSEDCFYLEWQSLPCLSRNLKENIKLLLFFNVFIRRMVVVLIRALSISCKRYLNEQLYNKS